MRACLGCQSSSKSLALNAAEVGHKEIYLELGVVKGQVETLTLLLNQHAQTSATSAERMGRIERTVYMGMGVATACSFIIPILVTLALAVAPRLIGGPVEAVQRAPQLERTGGNKPARESTATGEGRGSALRGH